MTRTRVKPGRRAAAAATGASRTGDQDFAGLLAARRADRMRHRLRHQLAPHYALTALVLAACAARAAAHLTGAEATVALSVSSAAFVAAVVAAVVARRRLSGAPERRWATVCALGAASWLSTVTATGLSIDAVGLLAVLSYALALPWWARHRIPNPNPFPAAPVEPDVDVYVERWAAHLGADGDLKGSRLVDREDIPAGHRYTLELVPGRHTYAAVIGMLPRLRTGLRLRVDQDLLIERHPELDESCLLLTVVTKPPVSATRTLTWPGPSTYADGSVALGPYVDGEGVGRWRVYSQNSIWGGFILGITGVGKSRVLDGISLSVAAAGQTVVWYADGQDGASSPGLAGWYDWSTDRHGATDMLAAALLIMSFRQAENLVDGREGFTPSRERPGLLIILDEIHNITADPVKQAAIATIAREGRKCGVAVIGASQIPNVGVFGPGDLGNLIRSCLTAGNLAAMHTTQRGAGNLIPGLPIDPCTLPAVPGYLFLAARGGGRAAALRGYYVEDTQAESERIPMPVLDRGSATAAGHAYRTRRHAADARLAAARALVDALRAGQPAPTTQTATRAATPTAAAVASAARSGCQVITFPTWPPQQQIAGGTLTDSQRAVLVALAAGHTRPGLIAEDAEVSKRHVYNLLEELIQAGYAIQSSYGHYALTDAGQHAIATALAG